MMENAATLYRYMGGVGDADGGRSAWKGPWE